MFTTFLVQPIYNGFIFLVGVMPHGDVGLAIIALTVIIRIVFYPAFAASIRTQMGMAAAQSELDLINSKYKDDADERARRTMELFKQHKVRPFASILALLVQLPVFFALYIAFFRENLPHIANELLYPFVHVPTAISTEFFGLVNLLAAHNIILAVVVALTQWAAIRYSMRRMKNGPKPTGDKAAMQKMQQDLMLYAMPVLLGSIAYSFPAAVAVYFTASNLISLGQEWIIARQLARRT